MIEDESCQHEKAFRELLQFLGRELCDSKGDALIEWTMCIAMGLRHLDVTNGIYCLAWGNYIDNIISHGLDDGVFTETYNQIKYKIDELNARVIEEEAGL